MVNPSIQARLQTAVAAGAKGDLLSAQQQFTAVLAQDRNNLDAMRNMAMLLATTERTEIAIVAAKRAILLQPDNFELWHNYGLFLMTVGRFEEAKAALLNSLKIGPPQFNGFHALGIVLNALGEFESSIAAFDQALGIRPDDEDTTDKRCSPVLALGRFYEGFIDNKCRWKYAAAHPFMHSPTPEWWGEGLTGKHIIVLHEQGYGDSFQFIRFLPWLKRKFGAAKVTFSCRPTMMKLVQLSGLCDAVCDIGQAFDAGADVKSPMLTVPAFMGLNKDNIPGGPYLKPPLRKLVLPSGGRKVGLVWGGIPMYSDDRWRSLDPRVYLPLFENHPDIQFYSLQGDERAAQLWQMGLNTFVTDLSGQLKDWLDTAAIVNELDLVISVDTAVAHLAGAMGKPVCMTIPQASCWRWMGHDTTTTPWYHSARLFRQTKQGDWSSVIDAVSEELGCG